MSTLLRAALSASARFAVRTDKFRQRLVDLTRDGRHWATVLQRGISFFVRLAPQEKEVEVPLDLALTRIAAARRRLETTGAVGSPLATLEERDPPAWGEPPEGGTPLVERAYGLRRKPLDTFTVEDLRLMIGGSSQPYRSSSRWRSRGLRRIYA